MIKILVVYYSMYGHVATLAKSVAEGVNSVADCQAILKRVPDLMSPETLKQYGANIDETVSVADPKELGNYHAILFGTPTRFGNMAAQMRQFLDQTGSLWIKGALIGKIGSVFTATGTGGGNETTITSFHSTLLHHGMLLSGLPYSCEALQDTSELLGGSPYGASTIAGSDNKRQVHSKEKAMAYFQGQHVAELTKKLAD